jgi:hypothetical protein
VNLSCHPPSKRDELDIVTVRDGSDDFLYVLINNTIGFAQDRLAGRCRESRSSDAPGLMVSARRGGIGLKQAEAGASVGKARPCSP